MHGSSKGVIRIADLRIKALVDRLSSNTFQIRTNVKKTYFSEITDSILDAKYTSDGRYILSRDYMTLRLWDTKMPNLPIHTSHVHPQLSSHFITLLDNEAIFDQFQCAMSRDGL
jgi:serine/threonine-protein phosphatase 2A regulatory subunit B